VNLVAASGSVSGPGRTAAATWTSRASGSPRSWWRSGSGAVTSRLWSWLAAWPRALMAERRATRSTRSISTVPLAALGVVVASPANTARAAASASTGSDLPRRRRACRLGRLTSRT
jgi:hypothetical protein